MEVKVQDFQVRKIQIITIVVATIILLSSIGVGAYLILRPSQCEQPVHFQLGSFDVLAHVNGDMFWTDHMLTTDAVTLQEGVTLVPRLSIITPIPNFIIQDRVFKIENSRIVADFPSSIPGSGNFSPYIINSTGERVAFAHIFPITTKGTFEIEFSFSFAAMFLRGHGITLPQEIDNQQLVTFTILRTVVVS